MKISRLICAVIIVCFGIRECARATEIQYSFERGGWTGGGDLTGSFVINENYPTQTGFLGNQALISFHAHWSGNIYTQPFNWGLKDVGAFGTGFAWNVQTQSLFSMSMGTVATNSVWCDPFLPLLWDQRPGHIDANPDEEGRYSTTAPFITSIEVVPDGGNTIGLLAIPVALFALARSGNLSLPILGLQNRHSRFRKNLFLAGRSNRPVPCP